MNKVFHKVFCIFSPCILPFTLLSANFVFTLLLCINRTTLSIPLRPPCMASHNPLYPPYRHPLQTIIRTVLPMYDCPSLTVRPPSHTVWPSYCRPLWHLFPPYTQTPYGQQSAPVRPHPCQHTASPVTSYNQDDAVYDHKNTIPYHTFQWIERHRIRN